MRGTGLLRPNHTRPQGQGNLLESMPDWLCLQPTTWGTPGHFCPGGHRDCPTQGSLLLFQTSTACCSQGLEWLPHPIPHSTNCCSGFGTQMKPLIFHRSFREHLASFCSQLLIMSNSTEAKYVLFPSLSQAQP